MLTASAQFDGLTSKYSHSRKRATHNLLGPGYPEPREKDAILFR